MEASSVSKTPHPASASALEVQVWVRACLAGRPGGGTDTDRLRVAKALTRWLPGMAMAMAQPDAPEDAFIAALEACAHA